ncbi:MAG: quinone oxidoreductase [Gemmatimonadetes bacterium]|jgi:NADPH2:quinone reductase|nr:quinone oxidoreductase [Gemmatimonadota bacterium]MBT5329000.1 quinone oxidoreductase [Gemmatimonadota bacterium]MBT5449325.1 quinone oxidoreductase [Gemmatimonadota bacterium]MBT5803467.1 quinone oxidoreductase [Gemmatimonadota bacterium]MBT6902762.1 quinone oxidoreductase [Gemmatimonadota bacterium]
MKAMRFHQHGGPEVLVYEDAPTPEAGPGEAIVRIEAIGLNYIDTYHRDGLYPVELPCIPGMEAAGTIARIGDGVEGVNVGDRVAYAGALGAYAEEAAVAVDRLVPLPDDISCEVGAAAMLQGMTAHYLAHSSYALGKDDTALIHAGAGGVGLLLIQMAKRLGARVLTTVSTEEKEQLARAAGADEVIRYTERDFAEDVMTLTDGRGVDVVYDSVGKTTFDKSLDVLRPLGYLVLFGQSSGPVEPVDPGILNVKGSLFLTRPTMAHYIPTREALLQRAGDVLGWIGSGELDLRIGDRFALADAADAHRALQGRKTTGKVVILPS